MATAVMSNPGLSLAVLGNPYRGTHHGRSAARHKGNTMARRFRRHYGFRLNPSIGAITAPIKAIPANLKSILSGSIKDKAIKGGFAIGGATVALVGGAQVTKMVSGFIPAAALNLPVVGVFVPRMVGGGAALLVGSLVAKFAPISGDQKKAVMAGAGLVAVLEIVRPGMSGALLAKIPFIGQFVGSTPVNGLGAYVEAPSYQGVGGYVSAPSYQGVGAYGDNMVAGYVSAPSYQGVGSNDTLAGLVGSNMPSFLDVGDNSGYVEADSQG